MNKFVIRIADLNIEINHRYDYVFDLCKDYVIDDNHVDISVKCLDEQYNAYPKFDKGYNEAICLYENIAEKIVEYNRVLIHGGAIIYKELAYLFLAPSKTGKSTHIKMWLDNIDGVKIINGDKPIIDSCGYVYGTPWCGKEGYNTNLKCKIGGVVILNRDEHNHIEDSSFANNLVFILSQLYKNNEFEKSINIIDQAFKGIPIYKLGCNKEIEAAKICFNKIVKEG